MESLKEIRKKISSVNNTKKTTKAMKLVSTSKLKKADEMAKRARVFHDRLNKIFDDIMLRVEYTGLKNISSKFFDDSYENNSNSVDIIFITSDKGLCGAFNSVVIKEVMRLKKEYEALNKKVRLRAIGKKGISFCTFNNITLIDKAVDISATPDYEKASEFIEHAVNDYLNGHTDEVIIVYNGFKNFISQELKSQQVLPLIHDARIFGYCDINKASENKQNSVSKNVDRVLNIEPEDEENIILDELAKKFLEYNMYYSLLDSLAAEHSARMQAMDAATNNATELLKLLTVSYNKARQENITTELVEINAGAEAMK